MEGKFVEDVAEVRGQLVPRDLADGQRFGGGRRGGPGLAAPAGGLDEGRGGGGLVTIQGLSTGDYVLDYFFDRVHIVLRLALKSLSVGLALRLEAVQ